MNWKEFTMKYGGGLTKYQKGGSQKDDSDDTKFVRTLPVNLAQPNDPSYNLRGYWDALGNPESFDYNQPTDDQGYYHAFSRHPRTGQILKAPFHPSFKEGVTEEGAYRLVSPRGDIYTQGFKHPAYEGPYALPKMDRSYDFLERPDYEGYFKYGGGLTKYQKKGEVKPFPLKPEEMYFKYQAKTPITTSNYNAALVPGGSPEVQKYQKMLNEKYGTFLVEEGAWGPKTQAAYEKYIVNKEQPPAFTPTHFRPTLEEFKSIYERIPSYNYGYESLYDADPKNIYVQQGPLTKERTEQIQTLPSEEQLRQSYLGKTFGGLPMFHASGIYEGYSPTRTWTGKNPHMVRDKDDIPLLKSKKPLYAYILSPKPGTQPDKVLTNPVTKEDLLKDPEAVKNTYKYIAKNASTIDNYKYPKIGTDYSFLDFADKINSFTDEDWANPEKVKSITDDFLYQDTLFGDYNNLNLKIPYADQFWGGSKTIESELLANPEIVKYTKEKGLDLLRSGSECRKAS